MINWPQTYPVLKSERLTLRGWQQSDLEFVYTSCQDPKIIEFTTIPVPYSRQEAQNFIETKNAEFNAKQSLSFVGLVNEKPALSVSLHHINDFDHECQIGYWVNADFRGQGLMKEAINLLTDFGFSIGFRRVEAYVLPENLSSQNALKIAGYSFETSLANRLTRRDGSQGAGLLFAKLPLN